MFKRNAPKPTELQLDQEHLQELVVARAAWEKKLIQAKTDIRTAEASFATAWTHLESIETAIDKVKDRVAAATIDAEYAAQYELQKRNPQATNPYAKVFRDKAGGWKARDITKPNGPNNDTVGMMDVSLRVKPGDANVNSLQGYQPTSAGNPSTENIVPPPANP